MNINELVNELDLWVNFTNPDNKQTRQAGLTIHYSPSEKKWTVQYGLNKASYKNRCYGNTIEEALQARLDKDASTE
jgi:hemolysin activation/secretion protein